MGERARNDMAKAASLKKSAEFFDTAAGAGT